MVTVAATPRRLRVLDVGAGAGSPGIPEDAYVTAIDVDEVALQRNRRANCRAVVDVQDENFEWYEPFDLIVCHDVLEHLKWPATAVVNMAGALAPGGRLVLGYPDPESPKAFLARWTPHRVHVWVYRMLGCKDAGKPGHAPYRVLGRQPTTKGIWILAWTTKLQLERLELRPAGMVERLRERRVGRVAWFLVTLPWRVRGLDADATELEIVLRRAD